MFHSVREMTLHEVFLSASQVVHAVLILVRLPQI